MSADLQQLSKKAEQFVSEFISQIIPRWSEKVLQAKDEKSDGKETPHPNSEGMCAEEKIRHGRAKAKKKKDGIFGRDGKRRGNGMACQGMREHRHIQRHEPSERHKRHGTIWHQKHV